MDRFTTKQLDETYHIYDIGIIHEINCCDENNKNWFSLYEGTAIDKLGQYEDTGLTPQEIEQMKARMPLHKWTGESPDKMSIFNVPVKTIMEFAEAEKQDRLVVLPCKVGTRTYRIVPDFSVSWPDPPEYKIIWDTFKLNDIYDFEKTVFLTIEEAETALNKYY